MLFYNEQILFFFFKEREQYIEVKNILQFIKNL